MHQKIINAFVAPMKYVWEQEFGQGLIAAETEAVEYLKTGAGITLVARVDGVLTGSFGLYLDDSTAESLSAGMRGRWVAEYENLMQMTLKSVCERVIEAANPLLAKIGYECQFAEVAILEEKGEHYPHAGGEQILVRFECEFGTIAMLLSFVDERTESARRQVAERMAKERAAADARAAAEFRSSLDFDPDQVPEVIRAQRFELVSPNGATRVVLGVLHDGSPHVVLADTNGRMRCALWLAPDGMAHMAFFDDDGRRSWLAA